MKSILLNEKKKFLRILTLKLKKNWHQNFNVKLRNYTKIVKLPRRTVNRGATVSKKRRTSKKSVKVLLNLTLAL